MSPENTEVFSSLYFKSSSMSPENTLSSFPSAPGMIVKVLEIPSCASLKGSLDTEARDATAPCVSRPCIGFAPGAKGWPFLRPSGVLPVALP